MLQFRPAGDVTIAVEFQRAWPDRGRFVMVARDMRRVRPEH